MNGWEGIKEINRMRKERNQTLTLISSRKHERRVAGRSSIFETDPNTTIGCIMDFTPLEEKFNPTVASAEDGLDSSMSCLRSFAIGGSARRSEDYKTPLEDIFPYIV